MKKSFAFLFFHLLILSVLSGQNPTLKPFGIKSGIIDYSYSGDKVGKVLTWNGILMMLDMNVMGAKSMEEATKVQINIPVDPKYFNISRNITFPEMPMF